MNTIAWIGFCQGLFAAILMFTKKESSISDKVLSGWLTLLAIEFMTCGLDYEIFGVPLLSSSFLLFNPALYLYVSSLTRPNFKIKPLQLLHLLPFLLFEISAYIIKEPFSLNSFYFQDKNFIYRLIFYAATMLSWIIYNPMSLILVHKYRMHLKNEKSNIDKNENLGWVLGVAIFYVVYCIFTFLITVFVYEADFNPLTPYIYNYSMLLFMIFVLSFYGLRQQVVQTKLPPERIQTHYQNSTLSVENKEHIRKLIFSYFESKKAYLNPELNMEMLSTDLKIPKYQLTEVLNAQIGKNFFQFVNSYRVEAVKQMLTDSHNKFSIEAIGYDCGFSSKSSFYTVFKSITGKTPIEYRNSYIRN
ncbi:MAG TPA: helix-turn-helix domain-containing protein [Paludibacter sp.]|nr:helix-turn-helix domain-containing protein [Paludibacter sp.]